VGHVADVEAEEHGLVLQVLVEATQLVLEEEVEVPLVEGDGVHDGERGEVDHGGLAAEFLAREHVAGDEVAQGAGDDEEDGQDREVVLDLCVVVSRVCEGWRGIVGVVNG